MITIISGTNRPNNVTSSIAKFYFNELSKRNSQVLFFNLENLPHNFLFENEIYGKKNTELDKIVSTYIDPAEKFVFISPEYNGGYPGILKGFIDSIWPKHFANKKAALVGVASGRAGNLRGMDQLTNVLHYLQVHVLPQKVPVSRVDQLLNANKELEDAETQKVLLAQMEKFLAY